MPPLPVGWDGRASKKKKPALFLLLLFPHWLGSRFAKDLRFEQLGIRVPEGGSHQETRAESVSTEARVGPPRQGWSALYDSWGTHLSGILSELASGALPAW